MSWATTGPVRQALTKLLAELYDDAGVRRWIEVLPHGAEMTGALPSTAATLSNVCDEASKAVIKHGCLVPALNQVDRDWNNPAAVGTLRRAANWLTQTQASATLDQARQFLLAEIERRPGPFSGGHQEVLMSPNGTTAEAIANAALDLFRSIDVPPWTANALPADHPPVLWLRIQVHADGDDVATEGWCFVGARRHDLGLAADPVRLENQGALCRLVEALTRDLDGAEAADLVVIVALDADNPLCGVENWKHPRHQRPLFKQYRAVALWPVVDRRPVPGATSAPRIERWTATGRRSEIGVCPVTLACVLEDNPRERDAVFCASEAWQTGNAVADVVHRHDGWALTVLMPAGDINSLAAALFPSDEMDPIDLIGKLRDLVQWPDRPAHVLWTDKRFGPSRPGYTRVS